MLKSFNFTVENLANYVKKIPNYRVNFWVTCISWMQWQIKGNTQLLFRRTSCVSWSSGRDLRKQIEKRIPHFKKLCRTSFTFRSPSSTWLLKTLYKWRGTPGDKADVPATELSLMYRISPSSFPLQSCRLSLSDAKNNPFRIYDDTMYRERQLRSGNESVEIRYMSDSSVAGTSASSHGVPRHMYV